MKYIVTTDEVEVPEGVTINAKSRQVSVKGPRGELKRNFRFASFDLQPVKGKKGAKTNRWRVQIWNALRKQKASCTTIASHIRNMIRGVTAGYKFKMRAAYNHFSIHTNVTNGGKTVEIKNFLGEKIIRKIDLLENVKATKTEEAKDELVFEGTDLQNVSLSCALVNQSMKIQRKDLRKFLDGIYVSDKRLDM
eukprot:TRINITY_DN0_c1105_g1_i2.p1 TRINITY_DN0_c1105_g1~~TRINITY_DN0_c1105_g1_i2.p1  ORF type:complete len:193 (-),score=65.74 TRINITY_DN0_c1105_g1_i2:134-712(-)